MYFSYNRIHFDCTDRHSNAQRMHEEPPPPTTVLSSPCPHLTIAGNRPNQRVRRRPTLTDNCPGQRIRPHPTAKNLRIAPQHSRHGRNLAVPKAPPRQPFHPLCALARHSSTIAPAKIRHHPTLTGNRLGRRVRRHPTAKSLRIASQHSHPGPHPGQLKRNRPDNRFILFAPSPDTHGNRPSEKFAVRKKYEIFGPEFGL